MLVINALYVIYKEKCSIDKEKYLLIIIGKTNIICGINYTIFNICLKKILVDFQASNPIFRINKKTMTFRGCHLEKLCRVILLQQIFD